MRKFLGIFNYIGNLWLIVGLLGYLCFSVFTQLYYDDAWLSLSLVILGFTNILELLISPNKAICLKSKFYDALHTLAGYILACVILAPVVLILVFLSYLYIAFML